MVIRGPTGKIPVPGQVNKQRDEVVQELGKGTVPKIILIVLLLAAEKCKIDWLLIFGHNALVGQLS